MRRFSFGLERVLELRAFREKAAEAELARRAGACALLTQRLEENARATLSASRERFKAGNTAEDVRNAERYSLRLAQEREKLMKALAMAEAERDKARLAYVEASRARELIEKLKEREEADYYKAASREETKVMDDIASASRAASEREAAAWEG